MKKIVIIGANSFQNPLIVKAKEMGYETHVFAWQDGSVGEKTADYFYPVSIVEKEQILAICKEIQPAAVATIASDLANITVQYLAKELGLPCNSDKCIQVSTNKFAMREAFAAHGVKSPKHVQVSEEEDLQQAAAELRFPVIVKPTDRSGSRGITRVEDPEGIAAAVKAAVADSFEKRAIIEEYIEGEEYSCECISYQGEHHILAVTRKYTTGYPHFIETAHLEPALISEAERRQIEEEIPKALDALEIQNGASHSEFKINERGEVRIIEIGSRMGGDCIGSHLVELSTGYDFVKMVLETALGEQPSLVRRREERYAGIRFIFSKGDLTVLEQIRNDNPKLLHHVSEVEEIGEHPVVDSSSRFGYFIIAGKEKKEIIQWLEK